MIIERKLGDSCEDHCSCLLHGNDDGEFKCCECPVFQLNPAHDGCYHPDCQDDEEVA